MTEDKDTTWARFHDAVNMTAGELEKWLATEESNAVGQKQGESESTGHASGRRIVEILRAKRKDLTEADYAHMRKVVGTPSAIWRNVHRATSTRAPGATR